MGTHITGMKTTVDIADALLDEARRLAERQGVTLRALVERGLNRVLADAQEHSAFKLRRASFKGEGLREAFRDAPWDRIRDAVYRDRGA